MLPAFEDQEQQDRMGMWMPAGMMGHGLAPQVWNAVAQGNRRLSVAAFDPGTYKVQ
jgi:hypothetical protein